jgi:tetratricopeptide (TPR) repeat protein
MFRNRMHRGRSILRAVTGAAAILLIAADSRVGQEQLWQHRNLGKAFYENPATQMQAVEEFRKALALAPDSAREHLNYGLALLRAGKTADGIAELEKAQKIEATIPHTWFNLGIAFKKQGQFDRAAAELEQMVKLIPDEPVSHYNLGVLHKVGGNAAAALAEFETAARLNPNLAGPHFQLYNAYRQAGRANDAARELALFQEIKKRNEGAAVPEDMEWSYYAEIYDAREPAALEQVPLPDRYEPPPPAEIKDAVSVSYGDFDNDGAADLCAITKTGAVLYHNEKGKFRPLPVALPPGRYTKAVWLDYDHDYDLDLFLLGEKSVLMRNNGAAGFSDESAGFPFVTGAAVDAAPIDLIADTGGFDLVVSYQNRAGVLYRDRLAGKYEAVPIDLLPPGSTRLVARDINRDGWTDLVVGKLLLLNRHGRFERVPVNFIETHRTMPPHFLSVTLEGVKNLKLATNAKVEVKAGTFYEKRTYEGMPLLFDLGGHTAVDTVRITWPNGLIQNEPKQPANRMITIKEAPRLSGSCPMIFTWNGRRFEFLTDVLGVAPLGASSGDGQYFPVDHDEYVQIPGESLAARNGRYEIRITEELHEVSYLDQLRLIALDHPRAIEIFTNDKFKAPPFPEFRLFGARRRIHPLRSRTDAANHLDLDFGNAAPGNRAVLLLHGWIDWPDGSMFRNAAQQHRDLTLPYLQVKDAAGNWRTVVEDMGVPSGKPKTIAVDLTGRFLSKSREIRIVTNLSVHWDNIFLSEDSALPPVRMTAIDAESAGLQFRGFSKYISPVAFDYAQVSPVSMWNPTPGNYTRYGDVRELVTAADDRMVIMGSGDELRLLFPASNLPPLPTGWRRDFLLLVDGWAKDGDPNTAFSQSVEPLPFHSMSQYPYRNGEHFPNDEGHRDYLRRYNTRAAVRLLQSLAE